MAKNNPKPENPENETKTPEEASKEAPLFGMAELSQMHRLPAWQLAAILRQQGWEEDRKVSEADFKNALADLKNRRMGGGRK